MGVDGKRALLLLASGHSSGRLHASQGERVNGLIRKHQISAGCRHIGLGDTSVADRGCSHHIRDRQSPSTQSRYILLTDADAAATTTCASSSSPCPKQTSCRLVLGFSIIFMARFRVSRLRLRVACQTSGERGAFCRASVSRWETGLEKLELFDK